MSKRPTHKTKNNRYMYLKVERERYGKDCINGMPFATIHDTNEPHLSDKKGVPTLPSHKGGFQ